MAIASRVGIVIGVQGAEAAAAGAQKVSSAIGGLGGSAAAASAATARASESLASLAAGWIKFNLAQTAAAKAVQALEQRDAFVGLQSRLQLLSGSAQGSAQALQNIFDIAQRGGVGMSEVANTYVRVGTAIKSMGGGARETARVVETLQAALRLNGATTAEANSVMLQFGQALAKGRVNGDEFSSLMENAPTLMNAVAASLGKTKGELFKMAEAGELTSDVFARGVLGSFDSLTSAAAQMPRTVGQAGQAVANAFAKITGESASLAAGSRVLIAALKLLADNAGLVSNVVTGALGVAVVMGTRSLGIYAGSAIAAAAANSAQAASTTALIASIESETVASGVAAAAKTRLAAASGVVMAALGGAGGLAAILGLGAAAWLTYKAASKPDDDASGKTVKYIEMLEKESAALERNAQARDLNTASRNKVELSTLAAELERARQQRDSAQANFRQGAGAESSLALETSQQAFDTARANLARFNAVVGKLKSQNANAAAALAAPPQSLGTLERDLKTRTALMSAYERDMSEILRSIAREEQQAEKKASGAGGGRGGAAPAAVQEVRERGQAVIAARKRQLATDLAAIGADARQAAQARLEATREGAAAQVALSKDTRERELVELKRGLDRETVTVEAFYAARLARAQADADDQIRLKRGELAQLEKVQPGNDADRAKIAGQRAKLQGEIELLRRARGRLETDNDREAADARLALAEQTERRRTAIEQRGVDERLALARAAIAVGGGSAAEVAQAEARAAEQRVALEISAAERILEERRKEQASAEKIKEAEDALAAARLRGTEQHVNALAAAAERVRELREASRDIRIELEPDPAKRAIAEIAREIERLKKRSDAQRATLAEQLVGAKTEEDKARYRSLLAALDKETADGIVALNERLADRLTPAWQRLVDDWTDVQRLMRDAADETMSSLLKGGEDAFVQLAQTGKLNIQSLIKDLQALAGRTVWRMLIGSEDGKKATDWVAKLLGAGGSTGGGKSDNKPPGEKLDPSVYDYGSLQDSSDKAASAIDKTAAAADKLTEASAMQAAAATANALGLGELGQVLQVATMTMTLFEAATKASAAAKIVGAAHGAVFTGAARFAAGGAFTNSVVSRSTMFRFRHGGRWRLGEMGEAGPEAIVPLTQRDGGYAMDAVDEQGRALAGGVRLRRGRSGRLAAVVAPAMFADGAAFGAGMFAAPASSGASSGGFALTQNITVAPGAGRNEVMLAMQAAKVQAVAEIEQRMRRNRAAYR